MTSTVRNNLSESANINNNSLKLEATTSERWKSTVFVLLSLISIVLLVSSSDMSFSPKTTMIFPSDSSMNERHEAAPSAPTSSPPASRPAPMLFHENWLDDETQTTESSIAHRVLHIPMAVSLRQFSTRAWSDIVRSKTNTEIYCALSIMATQNCDEMRHSLVECVHLFGIRNFEMILSDRCLESDFWKKQLPSFLQNLSSSAASPASRKLLDRKKIIIDGGDNWKKLRRGVVVSSTLTKKSDASQANSAGFPFIPPEERNPSPFPPPRVCANGCRHYPFGFAYPLSAFEKSFPRGKSFAWMPVNALRDGYALQVHEEDLFHELYKRSIFSWSHRRSGWECGRFHEEISSGTAPYFYDLEKCPNNSLGHYPKDLLLKIRSLEGVQEMIDPRFRDKFTTAHPTDPRIRHFIRSGEIARSNNPQRPIFNMTRYYELADQIFRYAKKYMTTRSLAAYMLKSMGAEHARTAIFFSRGRNDYTENSVLHGLGDLGLNVTIVSKQAIYDFYYMTETADGTQTRKDRDAFLKSRGGSVYGNGFGFAGKYPASRLHRPWVADPTAKLRGAINAKKFDVAIWQLSGKYYEFVEPLKQAGAKIAFLQFRDWHNDPHGGSTMDVCKFGGSVFIREMSDLSC